MLLRQMKYFLAAVYCKSFNEAAKAMLYLTAFLLSTDKTA